MPQPFTQRQVAGSVIPVSPVHPFTFGPSVFAALRQVILPRIFT